MRKQLAFILAIAAIALFALARDRAATAFAAQEFPLMDTIADRLIQKYEGSSCEQLWQERSQGKGQPSPAQQQAISLLQNNPQMRAAFINKVAAPIVNKMFECGMIP